MDDFHSDSSQRLFKNVPYPRCIPVSELLYSGLSGMHRNSDPARNGSYSFPISDAMKAKTLRIILTFLKKISLLQEVIKLI